MSHDRDALPTERVVADVRAPGRRTLLVMFEHEVLTVPLPATGEVTIGRGSRCDIPIDHPTLSRAHLALRLGATIAVVDQGSANGTSLRGARLPAHVAVEVSPYETVLAGQVALVVQEAVAPRAAARPAPRPSGPLATSGAPLLNDPAMRRLYEVADRVARGTIGVLIAGETGAGKEVLAEYLHRRSPRATAPLVRVNCAALTADLIESELFGHARGAFTGAVADRVGLIEAAAGGTVMLDEIGELPLATQAKLLRVLEDRRVTRVGETTPRQTDVRFVAATNRDLEADVAAGTFRRDLYFRIAGVVLAVPPLRARPSEIEPLARAFLAAAPGGARTLTPAALAALARHPWPGNVRELKSTLERAALLADDRIDVEHLGLAPEELAPTTAAGLPAELERLERQRIVEALETCGGNQTRAAALLGMPRRTFVKRLAQFGLQRPRDRA